MKKLTFVVLFSSLSFFASAGYTLSVDGTTYFPDANINLTTGEHDFVLYNDEPLIGGVDLILALHPISAANFIPIITYPIILPEPWICDPIIIPEFPDYDFLLITNPSPDPAPTPVGTFVEFGVYFNGPAADFEIWDVIDGSLLQGPYHLVPEPASLLLFALGGLALRIRKK